MAEVPPKQFDSQYDGKSQLFNQASRTAGDSQEHNATGNTSAPLPKGVVLDKDGKPYVH